MVDSGHWRAVRASKSGPKVSHLFFADDLLLFAEASSEQANLLKRCLDLFCSLSGQAVSYEKSLIFCSPNTCESMASDISSICGSPLTNDLGNYLGMPLVHERVNQFTYANIFDKVHSRLSSWKSKTLSMAGRLVLIQSASSAIPNYAMQAAKLPSSLCDKLDKLNRDFLWGDTENKKKVHLAMLAKASWRIWHEDVGLWTSIYKSKKGLSWRIGDGKTIKFWYDCWALPTALISYALPNIPINHVATVCEFWDDFGWNLDLLAASLPSHVVDVIINIPTGFEGCGDDTKIWAATSNGCFTVKSAYNSIFDFNQATDPQWKKIWSFNIPPKQKTFLWVILHKKLLTNVQRARRGFTSVSSCSICNGAAETFLHLFRDCPQAQLVWNTISKPTFISNSFTLDWQGIKWCDFFIGVCWFLWKWRNKKIFDTSFVFPSNPGKIILSAAVEWNSATVKAEVVMDCDYNLLT
ncbi:hypothetical protein ACLB2K_045474 [Fragaria x ananassa]